MTKGNSFATKNDVRKLQHQVSGLDRRLGRVEARVGKVEDRFVWFREEIKIDLKEFRESFMKEVTHEWQKKIDPFLAEIAKHRDQEVISAEQNRRTWDLLEKVAVKVGVPVGW